MTASFLLRSSWLILTLLKIPPIQAMKLPLILLTCQLLSPWRSIPAEDRFELSCDGDAGGAIVLGQLQHPEAAFRHFLVACHATITSMHMQHLHLPNLQDEASSVHLRPSASSGP